jgi:hypothetical protein
LGNHRVVIVIRENAAHYHEVVLLRLRRVVADDEATLGEPTSRSPARARSDPGSVATTLSGPGTAARARRYARGDHGKGVGGILIGIGEPLHGQRRPLERVREHDVVEEARVDLPVLVLLIHELVLQVVVCRASGRTLEGYAEACWTP